MVDVYGQRHTLRALTGHTLVDVLQEHQELLGDEGQQSGCIAQLTCSEIVAVSSQQSTSWHCVS